MNNHREADSEGEGSGGHSRSVANSVDGWMDGSGGKPTHIASGWILIQVRYKFNLIVGHAISLPRHADRQPMA